MKRYLLLSCMIFGVGLAVGCGRPPEQPPAATEAEYEEQKVDYQKSMDAGKAAVDAAKGSAGTPAPSGN